MKIQNNTKALNRKRVNRLMKQVHPLEARAFRCMDLAAAVPVEFEKGLEAEAEAMFDKARALRAIAKKFM